MPEEPLRLWEAWRTRGDARAFEDLVRPDLGRAVALARAEGCPPGEAEDAVQESLIRLAQERSDVPARVGVRGWFFGIVRDRARARLRSDRRRRQREQAAATPEAVPGGEARYALRDEVERALAGLPDEEREAIRLRYLLDLEYREVAYVLGTSEGASRMRVSRALKRLRSVLGVGAGAALATVVFPEPARASVLVSTALSVAPASAVTLAGGTILMTTGQKVVISAIVTGVLGAVLGAGVAHQVTVTEAAVDRERVEVDLASTRKDLAKAVAESSSLKERLHALQADRDSLAREVQESRASAKQPPKTGSPNGTAASSSGAPAQPTLSALEQKARDLSAAWVSDALQIQDAAKRTSALASIQEALGSGDPARVLAGLWAVGGIGQLKYDKAVMRAPVLSQLDAEDPMLRKGSLWALLNLDRQPGDLDLVLLGTRRATGSCS